MPWQRYIEAHGGDGAAQCPGERIRGRGPASRRGVILEDGRSILARRAVVSALEPKASFLKHGTARGAAAAVPRIK